MAEIGSTLREARIRARIDMSEVEARTKIRAKYLRAIENEEWDLLPGPVYAKSFLRTYGDYLGLDSRMLVEEFKRRYERPLDHEVRPVAPASRDRRRERPRMPPWAPVGIAIVAIVVLLYIVGIVVPGGTSTTASRHHRRAHRVRPRRHLLTTPARTTPARTTPARPPTVTLQLVPTGTVYVCLVNGRGVKLIDERTFTAGETIPTETARRLLLTLGRAAVQMRVNGQPYTVAPSPNAIRLEITPSGVTPIPLSEPPTCP
jgi:cytoskeleton protein RodZ